MEKYLRNAEEVVEKQRKAEEEFLKVLKEFDVEKPEESFKKLWVSKRCYIEHLDDRLEREDVEDWRDYLEKTFEAIAFCTGVYYEKYSKSWDRILYDRKRRWMVVLTEHGRIISSMRVNETLRELFDRHYRRAEESRQSLEIHKGEFNEELKSEAKRILKTLRNRK